MGNFQDFIDWFKKAKAAKASKKKTTGTLGVNDPGYDEAQLALADNDERESAAGKDENE